MVRSSSVVFPGSRGTHQIERQDVPLREPSTILGGKSVVLGKNPSLQFNDRRIEMAMLGVAILKFMTNMRCVAMNMLMAMLVLMFMAMSMRLRVPMVACMAMLVLVMMRNRVGRSMLQRGVRSGLKIEDARRCGLSASAMSTHQSTSSRACLQLGESINFCGSARIEK